MIFEKIKGSVVILSKNGKQYQREAYSRKGELFTLHGGGYVGLRRNGTSVDRLYLRDFDLGTTHKFAYTKTGRMVEKSHPDAHYKCSGCSETETEELEPIRKTRRRTKKK